MRFFGCLFLAVVVFIVLVLAFAVALAIWVASSILGVVIPGSGGLLWTVLVVAVVLAFASAVFGRMFGGAVRPLAALANAAERLADGESGVRVRVAGPGAVRRLGASFNAMAERLDRSRSDRQALLADVTHELRTPLQVIGGSVEAMLDGVHPMDEAHLSPILAEIEVMNRLLDDLRTVSLAESGALPLHREEVDVRRVEADVVAGHSAAAGEAGVSLSAAAGSPIVLDADPVRLREILANLVVNAIRHTPAGGSVSLDARVDGPAVELTVADTGEGIAPADLDRVFDRFHRRPEAPASPAAAPARDAANAPEGTPAAGDAPVAGPGSVAEPARRAEPGLPEAEGTPVAETGHRRDTGGSGLGLTIVRDLVAAHGGTVRAESEGIPGRGTTFRVRLPRRD